MDEDKHLKEREKLEAEISRSLSVVKMKEAHKQIEDIEKLRKQVTIKSVYERISSCLIMSRAMVNALEEARKASSEVFDKDIPNSGFMKKFLDTIRTIYESIHFDFQRTIDVKEEDFNRLFPKIQCDFNTYASTIPNLVCLMMQLTDMQKYCLRLL